MADADWAAAMRPFLDKTPRVAVARSGELEDCVWADKRSQTTEFFYHISIWRQVFQGSLYAAIDPAACAMQMRSAMQLLHLLQHADMRAFRDVCRRVFKLEMHETGVLQPLLRVELFANSTNRKEVRAVTWHRYCRWLTAFAAAFLQAQDDQYTSWSVKGPLLRQAYAKTGGKLPRIEICLVVQLDSVEYAGLQALQWLREMLELSESADDRPSWVGDVSVMLDTTKCQEFAESELADHAVHDFLAATQCRFRQLRFSPPRAFVFGVDEYRAIWRHAFERSDEVLIELQDLYQAHLDAVFEVIKDCSSLTSIQLDFPEVNGPEEIDPAGLLAFWMHVIDLLVMPSNITRLRVHNMPLEDSIVEGLAEYVSTKGPGPLQSGIVHLCLDLPEMYDDPIELAITDLLSFIAMPALESLEISGQPPSNCDELLVRAMLDLPHLRHLRLTGIHDQGMHYLLAAAAPKELQLQSLGFLVWPTIVTAIAFDLFLHELATAPPPHLARLEELEMILFGDQHYSDATKQALRLLAQTHPTLQRISIFACPSLNRGDDGNIESARHPMAAVFEELPPCYARLSMPRASAAAFLSALQASASIPELERGIRQHIVELAGSWMPRQLTVNKGIEA